MADDEDTDLRGEARYVFRATVRIEPQVAGVSLDPATFETTVFRAADPPGEPGWRFFRDNLWHGELSDSDHFRDLTADALGVAVDSVSFSELQTSEAYRAALLDAVDAELDEYNATSATAVLSKYLGSSIRITD